MSKFKEYAEILLKSSLVKESDIAEFMEIYEGHKVAIERSAIESYLQEKEENSNSNFMDMLNEKRIINK